MIELINRGERLALLPFYQNTDNALLLSGLQGHLGRTFLSKERKSALLMVQGFVFLSGEEDAVFFREAMAACDPGGFLTFSGSNPWLAIAADWGARIEMIRYALDTPVAFDEEKLQGLAAAPEGFEIKAADEALYLACRKTPWCCDAVSAFPDYAAFSRNGYAVMALKNGEIAAACGVYAPADGQWEVEIDTHPAFRRHGLAAACGAKFLLHCIRMEKVPHWDAMTPVSLSLAEKLGFQNPRPYRVVCREGEESIGYFAE